MPRFSNVGSWVGRAGSLKSTPKRGEVGGRWPQSTVPKQAVAAMEKIWEEIREVHLTVFLRLRFCLGTVVIQPLEKLGWLGTGP